MKKLFVIAFALLALGLLPVRAQAQEAPTAPPSPAAAAPEDRGAPEDAAPSEEESPDPETPPAGQPEEPDGTAPASTPQPEEPDAPEEPAYVPISPGLETSSHPVYLRGSGDMVRPDANITRAETACMIYSLLEAEPLPGDAVFSDVSPSAWYGPQVLALAEMGAVNGYENGTFQPGRTITRGEFVGILSRFFAPWDDAPQAFADVEEGMWFWQEINAASARGWINGYSDGTFRPGQKITRAEAAAILNRVLDRPGSRARQKLDADGKVLLFLDLPFTHWAYYDIMEAALEHTHGPDGGWAAYTVPAAAHAPGYHSIAGELYHVDKDGHWTRNGTAGVQKFDNNGKYTTGNAELDRRLTEIVRARAVEGDTALANFQRLYSYVTRNFTYRAGSFIADGSTGWEAGLALEMLRNGRGNCYRFAALGTMLGRKLGFQANGVSGNIDTGNGFVPHGWVQVEEGGRSLLCDPEIEYVSPSWDLFMKPYSSVYPRYMVLGRRL